MFDRRTCAHCNEKVSSADLRDGLAREVKGALYCRKCVLDLGLLARRGVETDRFFSNVREVLGDVNLSPQETLLVERKTRRQVAVIMEQALKDIEAHPSWERADITAHLKRLFAENR
ncbi:MAG: hypothetical protein ABIF71_06975 [Planctomycetota bacterium]